MADLVSAQGTTLTTAGWTAKPIAITIPGWAKSFINKTTLSNSSVTTGQAGTLKTYEPLRAMIPYDPSTRETVPSASQAYTVTLPGGTGAYTFYGQATGVGDVELVVDADQTEQLAYEVTISLTNETGGSETAPSFA